jgi:hypothetical protein
MSNPFKMGDKVVCVRHELTDLVHGKVYTLAGAGYGDVTLYDDAGDFRRRPVGDFRAAIAGQDYPIEPSGHHPDGGGIQSHSAGGLYPVVICWRDAKTSDRKYDAGVILPGHDPIWFKSYDAAVEFGEAWLKGKA